MGEMLVKSRLKRLIYNIEIKKVYHNEKHHPKYAKFNAISHVWQGFSPNWWHLQNAIFSLRLY